MDMKTLTALNVSELNDLLNASATHHHKLCPRQVLGVRIGLLAGRLFEMPLPQPEKRLVAIAETDGCFVDGLSAATHVTTCRRAESVYETAVGFGDGDESFFGLGQRLGQRHLEEATS